MMCYKDRTWCHRKDCANFTACDRAYTEEVHKAAMGWWEGPDAPVCFFVGTPYCFAVKEENNTNREGVYEQQ